MGRLNVGPGMLVGDHKRHICVKCQKHFDILVSVGLASIKCHRRKLVKDGELSRDRASGSCSKHIW